MYSFSILYLTVNESISISDDGVSKKLISKINAIRKFCPNCLLVNASMCLTHNNTTVVNKNDDLIDLQIGVKDANTGYLNKINSDKLFYKKLADYIIENSIACDRIIFRYPFATDGLKFFSQRFKNKIVFEHNSKEIEEIKINIANKKYASFSVLPSGFFYWYQEKKYPLYAEKKLAVDIMANALAGSCVTTEIAEYETNRAKKYKTFVASNFYDVSAVPLSASKYNKSENILTLGMIVTSTASWYGIERLMRSFSPVQNQYKLIIAGIEKENEYMQIILKENNIHSNVLFLGKINKQQLISFYNAVHVCFGSLGLYNINLNYASTLKVKESLAFGVPVVVGYKEEDFSNKEFSPYYLQVENNNSDIDFEEIGRFAERFYSNENNKITLRGLAEKYMDVNVKIKTLLENIKPA